MSHGATAPHEAARCQRTREQFREVRGVADEQQRATEITALPTVVWKGRTLKTLRCWGISGKGPHDCNVPESMLWALIGLQPFYCVYHAADAFSRDRLPRTSLGDALEPAKATTASEA